ncbi:MAG TPA: serpin family protein [Planctomycetaceae bacterium]|jgi:serpin B|nr:serpin family protein [Planctomycetaceae bacterium]
MIEPTKANRDGGTRWLAQAAIGLFFAIAALLATIIFCLAWRSRPAQLPAPAMDSVRGTEPAAGHALKTRGVAPPIPMPEIERRILAALEKPFPGAERGAEKPTLRDAVARIAKLLPVPVDFDAKALENASIDVSMEVELPQDHRSVGSVLDLVLSSAPQPVVWVVRNEALTITTAEKAYEMRDTRVYDVTDLADRVVTPEGVKWSDAARLAEIVRKLDPDMGEESLLDAVNVDDRALIVASLSRQAHQDLAAVLTKIRSAAASGSPLPSVAGPRRVAQKPRGKVPSQPVKATKGELAALEQLSKAAPSGLVPAVVTSSNAFTFDLYRQLAKQTDASLIVSPFGLYSALAMLKEGASGETERQMAHVLHATAPADAMRSSLRILSDRLSAIHLIPGYELVLRNQAWCEETLSTPQSFQDRLRDDYRAETVDVPFFKRPAEAAQAINAWFTAATNGRLKEIIKAEQITHDKLDFAVTSAVLFSGRWEDVFDAKETMKAPFHSGDKTFDVAMMSRPRESGKYAELDGVQVLKRPYRSGLLSALFLLPRASHGSLEKLEASLSAETLDRYRAKLVLSLVNVEIPRFEIGSDFRFEPALPALGMARAFTPTADFTKLGRPEWRLTFLRQKALIKLNEEGTQAAAATIGGGFFGGPRNEPYLFRANRPFLLVIQDESTGLVLFVARVTEPERAT